jgi:hypothetical protein
MIARLFNAPTHDSELEAVGVSTIGSSEAIILSVLAAKRKWQNKRKAEGKPWDKPNLVSLSSDLEMRQDRRLKGEVLYVVGYERGCSGLLGKGG